MKVPLIISLAILAMMAIGLFGCASNADYARGQAAEAARIQAACDDQKSPGPTINGHAYFCDDAASFEAQMQHLQHQLQQRGL